MAQVIKYRLRGGALQPKLATCAGGTPSFFAQTFGAERIVVTTTSAKTTLLASTDMQGQSPGDVEDPTYISNTYASASYQGRSLKTTDGDFVFSATEENIPQFIEEEDIGAG
jgi:hypothetical protein